MHLRIISTLTPIYSVTQCWSSRDVLVLSESDHHDSIHVSCLFNTELTECGWVLDHETAQWAIVQYSVEICDRNPSVSLSTHQPERWVYPSCRRDVLSRLSVTNTDFLILAERSHWGRAAIVAVLLVQSRKEQLVNLNCRHPFWLFLPCYKLVLSLAVTLLVENSERHTWELSVLMVLAGLWYTHTCWRRAQVHAQKRLQLNPTTSLPGRCEPHLGVERAACSCVLTFNSGSVQTGSFRHSSSFSETGVCHNILNSRSTCSLFPLAYYLTRLHDNRDGNH